MASIPSFIVDIVNGHFSGAEVQSIELSDWTGWGDDARVSARVRAHEPGLGTVTTKYHVYVTYGGTITNVEADWFTAPATAMA